MTTKNIVILSISIIGAIGLIVAIIIIWRKISNSINETKNAELAHNVALSSNAVKAISEKIPSKDFPAAKAAIENFDARPFGRMILDANGIFSHDANEVYNAFNTLKSQRELAFCVNYFKILKGTDLFTYLNSFLSADELAKVNDIIKKLPLY